MLKYNTHKYYIDLQIKGKEMVWFDHQLIGTDHKVDKIDLP